MKRVIVLGVLLIGLAGAGFYFLGRRLSTSQVKQDTGQPSITLEQTDLPTWRVPTPTPAPDITDPKIDSKKCVTPKLYDELRGELGVLVNRRSQFGRSTDRFAKAVDDFRKLKGIPLPLKVKDRAKAGELVFNSCQSMCRKDVFQFFVAGVDQTTVGVTSNDHHVFAVPFQAEILELMILDELKKDGVPFRSWRLPVSDGDIYIKGDFVYYPLDISDLWLQVSSKNKWSVVSKLKDAKSFELSDPEKPQAGCDASAEKCLEVSEGKRLRRFRLPLVCQDKS